MKTEPLFPWGKIKIDFLKKYEAWNGPLADAPYQHWDVLVAMTMVNEQRFAYQNVDDIWGLLNGALEGNDENHDES